MRIRTNTSRVTPCNLHVASVTVFDILVFSLSRIYCWMHSNARKIDKTKRELKLGTVSEKREFCLLGRDSRTAHSDLVRSPFDTSMLKIYLTPDGPWDPQTVQNDPFVKQNQSKHRDVRKNTLTMDDLQQATSKLGVTLKKPPYFH